MQLTGKFKYHYSSNQKAYSRIIITYYRVSWYSYIMYLHEKIRTILYAYKYIM